MAQKGSLNAADRLRFDFSHQSALTLDELKAVETEVNAYIRQNSSVETRTMTPDDARAIGAQALFGERYGDEVRVVSMGIFSTGKGIDGNTWSIELCGGTHVSRTGDIGVFVTLGDSASSAGVRRIEALTGEAAFRYLSDQDHRLAETALTLKTPPEEVATRVKALQAERRALQHEVAELRQKLALAGGEAEAEAESINGMMLHARTLKGVDGKSLPSLIDEYKARLGSGAVLLIAETGGKAAVAAGVTEDLIERPFGRGHGTRRSCPSSGARAAADARTWHEAEQPVQTGPRTPLPPSGNSWGREISHSRAVKLSAVDAAAGWDTAEKRADQLINLTLQRFARCWNESGEILL